MNGSPTPVENIAIGGTVTLTNNNDTGATTWAWVLLARPNGSTATLAAPTASTTSFIADLEGSYLVQLTVNGTLVSTGVARIVATHTGIKILARDEVEEGDASGIEGWALPSRESLQLIDKRLGLTNRRTVKYTGGATTGPVLLRITSSATLTNGDVVPTATLAATGAGYGALVFYDQTAALATNAVISIVEYGWSDLFLNPDTLVADDKVYMSSTPGALTKTQGSLSALLVGYCAMVSGGSVRLWFAPSAGSGGTVSSVSVTTANGVSGSVATATTTPAISLTLGAITPTSIVATGAISGTNLSGTNTGDLTVTTIGAVPNANAASVASQVLTLQPASASFGGVVTTGSQAFAGDKSFSGTLTSSSTSATALVIDTNVFVVDASANRVGVNKLVPTEALDVVGNVRFSGALMPNNDAGTSGYVLTSAGAGVVPTWAPAGSSGVTTMAAIGAVPNANAASISGSTLTLQPANASFGGVMTTADQHFTGVKWFDDRAIGIVKDWNGDTQVYIENTNAGTSARNFLTMVGNGGRYTAMINNPVGWSPAAVANAAQWTTTYPGGLIYYTSNAIGASTGHRWMIDGDIVKMSLTYAGNFAVDTDVLFVDAANNRVGVNKAAPTEALDVVGNVRFSGALMPNNTAGVAGQILTSAGPGAVPTWSAAGGSGVTTMAAIGAVPNANAASISGVTLTMQPANASFGGVMTTGTQTFAGAKTWNGTQIIDDVAAGNPAQGYSIGGVLNGLTGVARSSAQIANDSTAGDTIVRGLTRVMLSPNAGATPGLLVATNGNVSVNSTSIFVDATNNRLGINNGAPTNRLQVDTNANGQGILVNSPTTGWPGISVAIGGTTAGIVGAARTANDISTGSSSGDLVIRGTQKIVFTADAGTTAHAILSNAGALAVSGAITGSNLSGTNTGNVTLTAIGAVPNANAASLSGQILTLQPANASFGGVITTGTQTIAGDKTFSGAHTITGTGGISFTIPAANQYMTFARPSSGSNANYLIGNDNESNVTNYSSFWWMSIGTAGWLTNAFTGNIIASTASGSGTAKNLYLMAKTYTPGGMVGADMTMTLEANTGRVGIGKTSPTEILDVVGNVRFSGALMPNNTAGVAGEILTSAGPGAVPTWNAAGGSGVTTMAAIGAVPNANAASISGVTLTMQPANGSFGGVVTTGTQTFAGMKSFTTGVEIDATSALFGLKMTTGAGIGWENGANDWLFIPTNAPTANSDFAIGVHSGGAFDIFMRMIYSTGYTRFIYGVESNAASGADAYRMLNGAHLNFSTADSLSYLYRSAADTISTAGNFNVGDDAADTFRVGGGAGNNYFTGTGNVITMPGEMYIGGHYLDQHTHTYYSLLGNIYFAADGSGGGQGSIHSAITAANADATFAGTAIKVYTDLALDAGDRVFGVYDVVGTNRLLSVDYDGSTTAVNYTSTSGEYKSPSAVKLISSVADGASAVAASINTTSAWSNATAKLLSVQNNSVEKGFMYSDGAYETNNVAYGNYVVSRSTVGGVGYYSAGAALGFWNGNGSLYFYLEMGSGGAWSSHQVHAPSYSGNSTSNPNYLTSEITAANATATNAAVCVYPENALADADSVFMVSDNTAVLPLFAVAYNGDTLVDGDLAVGADLNVTGTSVATYVSGPASALVAGNGFNADAPSGNNAFKMLNGAAVNFSTADTLAYLHRITADTVTAAGAFEAAGNTHVRATSNTTQSFTTGTPATLTFDTETYDTLTEFVPATGIFTAGKGGYYNVSVMATLTSDTPAAGDNWQVYLSKNGVPGSGGTVDLIGTLYTAQAAQAQSMVSILSGTVYLAASDTLRVRAMTVGATRTIQNGSNPATHITIDRIP